MTDIHPDHTEDQVYEGEKRSRAVIGNASGMIRSILGRVPVRLGRPLPDAPDADGVTDTHPTSINARLAESEERYRAVIDNASDMIQSIRPDGTFEFVNQAWLNQLGYTRDEVASLNIWDIVHSDAVEHCQILFSKALTGAPIATLETMFVSRDGRPIPVEGSATSRFIGDTVVATHGFFRDISERLRAEELATRNLQLEREHQARYLEKMAALGKLSAGLAHEFNNPAAAAQRASARLTESLDRRDAALGALVNAGLDPRAWSVLNGLLGDRRGEKRAEPLDPLAQSDREMAIEAWLEDREIERAWELASVLVTSGVTETDLERASALVPDAAVNDAVVWLAESLAVHEYVDIVTRGSHRISELVDSIKVYSHMDRATEQEVDIHDGLESTLIILGHRLRDVTIDRQYARDISPVQVFGNTLNQVWTNILDNAVDAVDERGTITIRTAVVGDAARVEIEDDGSGISPEDLACIFEPFFTTKPQGQGTGLGLDTAWRIVTEEHGGTIEVESRPGRTCFQVTIPLRRA